jgi:hypothetical protein
MSPNQIVEILYAVIIFSILLTSSFIVYHIVRYSFSKLEMIFTLALFLVVISTLIFANFAVFSSIDFGQVFI